MKWYNFEDYWLDISKSYGIKLNDSLITFIFSGSDEDMITINYGSVKNKDAEFEKIKALMGIKKEQNVKAEAVEPNHNSKKKRGRPKNSDLTTCGPMPKELQEWINKKSKEYLENSKKGGIK